MLNLLFMFLCFLFVYLIIKRLLKKLETKLIQNRVGFQVAQLRNIPEGLIYIIIVKELIALVLSFLVTSFIYLLIYIL